MNGRDVHRMLLADSCVTDNGYSGVFSVDQVPELGKIVCVINTSPSWLAVGHWVAVVKEKFFCSFGFSPQFYGIDGISEFNDRQIQSPNSSVCGLYVVAYIKACVRGYTTGEFINIFTDDHSINDKTIVRAFQS